ncbi:cytochrome P450 [Hesseltinella vesiculosa]|uniref:Cytochrome P450 n=1 Tax=Hesseltinella vesiculosa TaxID=101127 RepID=A0A1X2G709_9FUNG|nr:cytochrome P450 [Hesseltinella vesiculosa]
MAKDPDSLPLAKITAITISVAIGTAYFWYQDKQRQLKEKYPWFYSLPSPAICLPIVESPFLRLQLGSQRWLTITDPRFAEDLMTLPQVTEMVKPYHRFIDEYYSRNRRGIVYADTDSPAYKEIQPIVKDYIGQLDEADVALEVDQVIAVFKSETGPFNPVDILKIACRNCLLGVAYAKFFPTINADYKHAEIVIRRCFPLLGAMGDSTSFLPFLKYWPGIQRTFAVMQTANETRDIVVQRWMDECNRVKGHCLVKRLQKAQMQDGSQIQNDDIFVSISDVSGKAGDQIPIVMVWNLQILANHPDVQDAMFNEIQHFVQVHGRYPIYTQDEAAMPVVSNTLKECLRYKCCNIFNVARMFKEDVTVRDRTIPKDTVIAFPINAMHTSLTSPFYDNPHLFNPERFNHHPKKTCLERDLFLFGFGPRQCPGASFVNKILFTMFVKLFHQFKFLSPHGPSIPLDLDSTVDTGVLLRPIQMNIALEPRDILATDDGSQGYSDDDYGHPFSDDDDLDDPAIALQ